MLIDSLPEDIKSSLISVPKIYSVDNEKEFPKFGETDEKYFCLPFNKLYVEVLLHEIGQKVGFFVEEVHLDGKLKLHVRIVQKIGPDPLFFINIGVWREDRKLHFVHHAIDEFSEREKSAVGFFIRLFYSVIIKINSDKELIVSTLKRKTKSKVNGKNQIMKDRITVISSKKYVSETEKALGRKLNWTTSFLVRGHWRKIAEGSIGVDRSGKRGIVGMTWINAFKKGSGELLNNWRVVQ